ncbi:hypothetical protein GS501_01530 [Saccharibacter sp. 17.LH.SD]|uniref:hypothetical protein n=1 Tax=Saccharibacter sp. 17.LH.SD TaxID=2689393 RepID=UPI00136D6593|nr:hypothetical protein [Saccharibacter sp. 17.LH.SD]MXV43737.1 hypothetical protein [Saccharibacter sp. 17.LH.SD]
MQLAEMARRVDDAILDGCFQPIVNRLPQKMTAWSLGTSFHVGAVLFYIVSFIGPVIFVGASADVLVQTLFAIAWIITLVLVFQRFRPHGQQNAMNPSRIMLRSMRLWSLAILLYGIYGLHGIEPAMGLWEYLDVCARAALVIGLYFMACQSPPPGMRRSSKWKYSFRRRGALKPASSLRL